MNIHRRAICWGLLLGLLSLTVAGCDAKARRRLAVSSSKAKSKLSNAKASKTAQMRNGNPDAGLAVTCTAQNVGEAGLIHIEAWLTCSEGEWTREQNLSFKKGQKMKLSYFFHEPTINATNIQYGFRSKP